MHFHLPSLTALLGLCISLPPLVELNSHSSHEELFLGKYPTPSATPSPIDISSTEVKNDTLRPVYLKGVASDKVKLINTGQSIIYVLDQPDTKSYITGGPFSNDKYKFAKVRFYWVDHVNEPAATTIDGKDGAPIEAIGYFYNMKYRSFKNALRYRDGLAQISFRIKITEQDNELFSPFGEKMKEIRQAGSSTTLTLGEAIKWYSLFPPTTWYYTYPASYTNEKTNEQYFCSTVIIIPHYQPMHLSQRQFDETYGSLKNQAGAALINKATQFGRVQPVVHAKQIKQIIVPGDGESKQRSPESSEQKPENESEDQNKEESEDQNEEQSEDQKEEQPEDQNEKQSEDQNKEQSEEQNEEQPEDQNENQLEDQNKEQSEDQNKEQSEDQHEEQSGQNEKQSEDEQKPESEHQNDIQSQHEHEEEEHQKQQQLEQQHRIESQKEHQA